MEAFINGIPSIFPLKQLEQTLALYSRVLIENNLKICFNAPVRFLDGLVLTEAQGTEAEHEEVRGISNLLIGIHNTCVPDNQWWFRLNLSRALPFERYMQWVNDPTEKFLIARYNGEVVGYALGGIITRRNDPSVNEEVKIPYLVIHEVSVKRSFWRKGVFTALLHDLAAWGREHNVTSVEISTKWWNYRARRAYRKVGFENAEIRMSASIDTFSKTP